MLMSQLVPASATEVEAGNQLSSLDGEYARYMYMLY